MSHDPHLGFVAAAYALAFVIVAGMIVTIIADYRNLTRALSSFAAQEKQQSAERRTPDGSQGTSRGSDAEGVT
jgi:heme exporter protein CcmD